MRKTYPSDITREQFDTIRPILESVRKKTKPRTVDLYDVVCGVLYVLKTGCQWRALPHEYPTCSTTYAYFQKWSEEEKGKESVIEQLLKKISWRGAKTQWTDRENKHGHR
jgi:transposase